MTYDSSRLHSVDRRYRKPGMCMAVGCTRKAIYRSCNLSAQRGYCKQHKDLAILSDRNLDNKAAFMAARLADMEEYREY
jgi:hypothetical protein